MKKKTMLAVLVTLLVVMTFVITTCDANGSKDENSSDDSDPAQTAQPADESESDSTSESAGTSDNRGSDNTDSDSGFASYSASDSSDASGSSDNAGNNGSSDSDTNGSSGSGNLRSEAEPDHVHTWQDHVSTYSVWVSNWVEVPDYVENKVPIGTRYTFAEDDYTTTSVSDAYEHSIQMVLNGYAGNYTTETVYETTTVQVGSHMEDQGHYENRSVVDFTYCTTCGLVKGYIAVNRHDFLFCTFDKGDAPAAGASLSCFHCFVHRGTALHLQIRTQTADKYRPFTSAHFCGTIIMQQREGAENTRLRRCSMLFADIINGKERIIV